MEEKIEEPSSNIYIMNQVVNIYNPHAPRYTLPNTKELLDEIEQFSEDLKEQEQEIDMKFNEIREGIKELEIELYLSNKLQHLFWKYILAKSDILTFMFENISG